MRFRNTMIPLLALLTAMSAADAQEDAPTRTLFTNVNVFDGFGPELRTGMNVLVEGNHIAEVSADPISVDGAIIIDGDGRTMTPGLIDMHTHVTFETTAGTNGFNEYDFGGAGAMAAQALRDNMLMKGITTARDIAGNSRGIARLIQRGQLVGPRLYTSGGVLSPTGGHGDWGGPTDTKRNLDYGAMVEQSFIIEGRDSVIEASRRNFRNGAHFTKIMAGGGVASLYDPLEIYAATQEEVEAAVLIAGEYGTYVAIHAYHDGSYNRSLDAGVRSFEHGFLVTEPTVRRMAELGQDIAWSFQCFMSVATFGDYDSMPGFFTHEQKLKGVAVGEGARNAAAMMLEHDVFMIGGVGYVYARFRSSNEGRHYLPDKHGRLPGAPRIENVDWQRRNCPEMVGRTRSLPDLSHRQNRAGFLR